MQQAVIGQLSVLFQVTDWCPVQPLRRRQVSRDKATNIARAMSNVSSAVIFGGIFWRMGRSQSSIQDRMGLLQVRSPRVIHCFVAYLRIHQPSGGVGGGSTENDMPWPCSSTAQLGAVLIMGWPVGLIPNSA